MKSFEFETRSLDEAKEIASKEMRINKDLIDIEVVDKRGMIIKTYSVRATINVDPAELGYNALTTMLETMQIKASVEMRRKSDHEIADTVNTEENPLLIGIFAFDRFLGRYLKVCRNVYDYS